jgi:hypothetical protein
VNDGRLSIFIWDSGDIGVECVETSEEQTPHYLFSVVGDNLRHDIANNVTTMAKSQFFNHVPIHSQRDYKLNVRKADYKLL